MSTRYRLFRIGIALCLAVVSLGWGAGPGAADELPPAATDSAAPAAWEALQAKAAATGSVLVIAGLRLPEAGTLSAAAEQAARQQAQAGVDAALAAAGAGPALRFRTLPFVSARVDAAGLAALRASPWVTSLAEDVPEFPSLAESTLVIGAATPLTGAWARGFTGAGQVVAILDTGVDKTHPFLAGKVVAEACFSNAGGLGTGDGGAGLCPGGDPNQNLNAGAAAPCGLDGCDHGTHVAGIAAGKAYSGMDGGSPQFSGVAPDAQIIAIQVFTQFGTDVGTYSTDQASALDYINTVLRTQFNVAAVNMSLGGTLPFSTPCDASQTLRKTSIDNLRSHGIPTVIASGNSGFPNGLSTPACISTAVSVGSTRDGGFGATPVDTVSSFSNSASYLSLLAPGQLIRSSVPGGLFSDFQGTSMAAPHVAGAWAVLKEARPTASVSEILALLQSTGLAVTDARNGFTQSRIQLDAALSDQLPYFTSTAYAFGRVMVDLSSQASVTLQNPLSVPITVTTPSLSGTGLSLSASTCPAGGRLAAGGTCALTVKYAPSAPATLSGTLNLVYTPTATFSAGALQATFSGQAVELCADNLLNNAVFERVDASWVQTDTVAGAALPLCPPSGCPLGGFGPAGPYSGGGWALFGAYTDTITATTTVTQRLLQSVVVPANSLSLQFVFAISRADPGSGPADRFEAWLDNTRVFTATAADRPQYAQYSTVRISLPPVALPVTRTLTFSATTQLTGPVVDFNLDDVALCSPAFFPIYLPNVSRGQ